MLGSVFFQTLDETERGAGGFGSTGTNWTLQAIIVGGSMYMLKYKDCVLIKLLVFVLQESGVFYWDSHPHVRYGSFEGNTKYTINHTYNALPKHHSWWYNAQLTNDQVTMTLVFTQ